MFGWFKRLFSPSARVTAAMRATNAFRRVFGWDAAKNDAETRKHWQGADILSADAANSREVRRVLVIRSRYERDNNPVYAGIARTVANDVIGTGPILQVLSNEEHEDSPLTADQARRVERAWRQWSQAIDLPGKLLVMEQATLVDGESFAPLTTNPGLPTEVKLDLVPIECDRVTTPMLRSQSMSTPQVDGLELDDSGRTTFYHILKQHPGSAALISLMESERVSADFVVHRFNPDRAEQHRGVPEFVSSLPLGAYMRRYTLATVSAAELIALMTVMFETDASPDEAAESETPFAEQDITRGMGMHLPAGMHAKPIDAKQPAAEYGAFRKANNGDFARPRSVPLNIALCDSSGYNYASGRLDHQTYDLHNNIARDRVRIQALDGKIFVEFWRELVTTRDFVELRSISAFEVLRDWIWGSRGHVDRAKEAAGAETELRNNTTTLAAEYAKKGKNWETELRQRAREVKLARELGLPENSLPGAVAVPAKDEDGE